MVLRLSHSECTKGMELWFQFRETVQAEVGRWVREAGRQAGERVCHVKVVTETREPTSQPG